MRLLARMVAAFLQLLYTHLAFAYDIVAWIVSGGHWIQWASTGLSELPTGLCLELGHGPGHLLVRHGSGRTLVGIDASRQMSRLAAHRQRRLGRTIRSVHARAQALPFGEQSFEGVLSTFPSEYAFDARTILEVARVLKAGGMWLILPQARVTGGAPYQRLLAWVYRITGETRPLPESWLEMLRRQGFLLEIREVPAEGAAVEHLVARKSGQALPPRLSTPARRC